jgi:hypothetical protein
MENMADEYEKRYNEIQAMAPKAKLDLTSTIVCTGAPGSGKTTYVQNNAGSFDMVYDFDLIERAISMAKTKDDRPTWSYQFIDMVKGIMLAYRLPPALWMVATMPTQNEKEYYAKKYNAKIIVLDPGIEVCKQRVIDDPSRMDKAMWLGLVDKYYAEYEPFDGEEVINE